MKKKNKHRRRIPPHSSNYQREMTSRQEAKGSVASRSVIMEAIKKKKREKEEQIRWGLPLGEDKK